MTKQPEALLEHNLIQQLLGLGYSAVKAQDGEAFAKVSPVAIIGEEGESCDVDGC